MPRTCFVACGVTDAHHLPELTAAARELGAVACVLQGDGPSLSRTLTALDEAGDDPVVLVGVSGDGIAAGLSWVRRVAAHWMRETGSALEISVVPSIARSTDVGELDVIASFDPRPVTGREAPLENPTWEKVPAYRHHVLVCRGPRCTAKGSDETIAALSTALWERRLLDRDVLVASTGCLSPCNSSPVVVVHPADEWYGPVDADAARALVEGRLVGAGADEAMLPRRITRSIGDL